MRVNRFVVLTAAMLVTTLAATAKTVAAAPLCISVFTDSIYQLSFGVAGDAVIVSGIRKGPQKTTFTGTAFGLPDGSIVIGWSGHFDASATITGVSWVHPAQTVLMKVDAGTGVIHFDATYHGNPGFAPIKVATIAQAVSCSGFSPTAPASSDPNLR